MQICVVHTVHPGCCHGQTDPWGAFMTIASLMAYRHATAYAIPCCSASFGEVSDSSCTLEGESMHGHQPISHIQ